MRHDNKVLVSYVQSFLVASFGMENSKWGLLPFRQGIHLSKGQSYKTPEEKKLMSEKLYASTVGSLMYDMLCIGRDIFYVVEIISRYKSYPKEEHRAVVKTYAQVSKENERLYVGVFQWESWNTWLYIL